MVNIIGVSESSGISFFEAELLHSRHVNLSWKSKIRLPISLIAKLYVMLWLQAMYKTLGYREFFNWQVYDAFRLFADIMQSVDKGIDR